LVTGRSPDGRVFPIYSLIHFAEADRIPARDVSIALIDVATGQLMSRPKELWGAKRLNNQADDSDFCTMLPDWEVAVQYAKAAHHACANFAFIGWDIAFTVQGPILLEGNENWSAVEYQGLRGEPLGHTRFADILATWLPTLS
jgi:hypothetical protein